MAASRPREPDAPARLIDVALGGALGTGVRLLLAGPVVLLAAPPGPLRLLSINVGGALLLGLLLGLRERSDRLERWWPLLATGLLGGLTTFSTMIVQAGSLGHAAGLVAPGSGRMTPAGLGLVAGYLVASVALGLAAVVIGRALTGVLRPSSPAVDPADAAGGGAL
jgi:CrcB protein